MTRFKKAMVTSTLLGAALLAGCQTTTETVEAAPVTTDIEVISTTVASAPAATAMLADFDTNGATIVDDEATSEVLAGSDSNNALKMIFSPTVNTSSVYIKPSADIDFSTFDDHNLAFEVTNLNAKSTHLYVAIESADGHVDNHSLSLPGGYSGTVFIVFSGDAADIDPGLWGRPVPWETDETMMVWRSKTSTIDRDQVTALKFHTIGILEERSVVVDNLRMRQNPEVDPNWLTGLVDEYGQNAKIASALDVSTDEELRTIAEAELADLAESTGMPDRSKFGGYKLGPKLKATGYFRTAKVNDKWWMVDPEGYLFFSHGPANVRMANMTTITGVDYTDPSVRVFEEGEVTPEDSMGIIKVPADVKATRFITNETRHKMFEWLPDYDGPLGDHYSYRRSTHIGPVEHGETFSFYRANLERRYGETSPESYFDVWVDTTLDRMKDWGFTSFGNWVDPAFYPNEQVPYFANGWIIGDFKTLEGKKNHWGLMPDFYDPVFAERAKATIDVIAKDVKGSPWCVGIFIDNEKSWGLREGDVPDRYGVILDALSKDASESPAKAAFAQHLKTKYGTIGALNSAWQSELEDWAAFDTGVTFETFSDAHVADLSKMLEMLGEKYFEVVHSTLEEALPNHLYMGARMANWGMPDEIIKASLKYSDVLSFNIYEQGVQPEHWDFLEEVDLPVTIGEFHIGSNAETGFYNPGIVHAADRADQARMYKDYMRSVLEKPYMVGAHWFQYIDEPITGRAFDGENAQIGFVNVADIPYPEFIEAVKDVTRTMYSDRYGSSD